MASEPPTDAAGAAIFDEAGRILLIKENYDRERWGFPGGAVELGETPEQAVVREVREETGVDVRIDALVGVYVVADSALSVYVFRCEIVDGTPAVPRSGEIADVRWWPTDALPWPRTNALYHALPDAVAGRSNLIRRALSRVT